LSAAEQSTVVGKSPEETMPSESVAVHWNVSPTVAAPVTLGATNEVCGVV
jgi:hypothetical protein